MKTKSKIEYLDSEEKDLIESYGAVNTPASGKPSRSRQENLKRAARTFLSNQEAKMNIRIYVDDLKLIKERAAKEGLKYSALVKSVMHKYVTNQLVSR